MVLLAEDDDGYRAGETKNCKASFFQLLCDVWMRLADDGVITMVRVLSQGNITFGYSTIHFEVNI